MSSRFHFSDLPAWITFIPRLLKRLVYLLLILGVLALIVEGACRLFGHEDPPDFLVAGESQGEPTWVNNPFFTYRFYPPRLAPTPLPILARQQLPEGAIRICLLGGSTAMGMPEPAFGPGPQLQLLLEHRYPDHSFEVISMGYDGANSHILREVALELERLRPHAVVVLIGNDEVAGPYGPATGLGRLHMNHRAARALVVLSRTRVACLLARTWQGLNPERIDQEAWKRQEPIHFRGRLSPSDRRLRTVERSFRKNLEAILKTARQAAPVVIVGTMPVNLRDCAPFATEYLADESKAQEVREILRAAIDAENAANHFEAARLYAQIIALNPDHAEALFRSARLALANHRTSEAAELLARARDTDALRLRADSTINTIIRECALKRHASLLDLEAYFAGHAPQGIPGSEHFIDHVHLSFKGSHLIASALLHRLEFLHLMDAPPSRPVQSAADMAISMLYQPWGRVELIKKLIRQQLRPPFRRQITNAATLARLRAELETNEKRAAATSPELTAVIFSRRLNAQPGDGWLALRAAWHLLEAGNLNQAEEAAAAAHAIWPHRYDARTLLALIRTLKGEPFAEQLAFLRAGADPHIYADVHHAIAIGRQLLESNHPVEARPWLEYALERDPWNSEAAIVFARILHQIDTRNRRTAHLLRGAANDPHHPYAWTLEWFKSQLEATESERRAVDVLNKAIKRNPHNPLLWEELAVIHTLMGTQEWEAATRCFERSETLAPYRYERYLKWAEAMFRLRQFRRAKIQMNRYLTYMPDDPEALALEARIDAKYKSQAQPVETDEEGGTIRRILLD
ncbi:MAG: tetratricopeptide repeat protein [Lentisphaerae bacterium]|jgi:tetratricopeptide (TPR) repeat protein|nr:tetratricopeptide repeat protein [Lentisphaerota bacterium]